MFCNQYQKRYSSASTASEESAETVPLEEFNKLKKKLNMVKELVSSPTADGKYRSKRTKIALILPEFTKLAAHQKQFTFYSDAVDVAGFQWKLGAHKSRDFSSATGLKLYLFVYPPAHYKGPFELDVTSSFRLLNVFPGKDINKHGTIKFKRDVPNSWGYDKFIEKRN